MTQVTSGKVARIPGCDNRITAVKSSLMTTISVPGVPLMTPQEFRILRDYLYRRCGLYFEESKKFFLERKLRDRVGAMGMQSYSQYFMNLHGENEWMELKEIYKQVTTTETGFFRNRKQMNALRYELMDDLIQEARRRPDQMLKGWSAGCSTGEEAYSLAMLIRSKLSGSELDIPVRITGSDINERALKTAEHGLYDANRCTGLPQPFLDRYMEPVGDRYRVCDRIRDMVSLTFFNLADTTRYLRLGRMDFVFCRNVLIYFGDAVRKEVLQGLARVIRPGGLLFLGYSEHLPRQPYFDPLIRDGHTICYRRIEEAWPQ